MSSNLDMSLEEFGRSPTLDSDDPDSVEKGGEDRERPFTDESRDEKRRELSHVQKIFGHPVKLFRKLESRKVMCRVLGLEESRI